MLRDFTRSKRHLSHHNDNYRRNLQAAFRCAVYAAPAVGTSGISRPRERSSQRTRRLCSGPPLSSPPLGRTALQLRLLRPIQLVILLLILHILLALLILLPHPPSLSLLLLLGPGEASRSAVHLPARVLLPPPPSTGPALLKPGPSIFMQRPHDPAPVPRPLLPLLLLPLSFISQKYLDSPCACIVPVVTLSPFHPHSSLDRICFFELRKAIKWSPYLPYI